MSKIVLLDPELTPHVNFSNFQAEEIFLFFKFLGRLYEKRAEIIENDNSWAVTSLSKVGKKLQF